MPEQPKSDILTIANAIAANAESIEAAIVDVRKLQEDEERARRATQSAKNRLEIFMNEHTNMSKKLDEAITKAKRQ